MNWEYIFTKPNEWFDSWKFDLITKIEISPFKSNKNFVN